MKKWCRTRLAIIGAVTVAVFSLLLVVLLSHEQPGNHRESRFATLQTFYAKIWLKLPNPIQRYLPRPRIIFAGFPIVGPIRDADPTVRHPITVRYPTKLNATVSGDTLAVSVDVNSCESTNMMVGRKMIAAARDELFLHPECEPRPLEPSRMGLHGGMEFGGVTNFFDLKQYVGLSRKRLVVEMDMTIFETDIPPQHMWSPHSAKYKELWKYTLTQVVK